jgi:hypothetical protein
VQISWASFQKAFTVVPRIGKQMDHVWRIDLHG